MELSAGELSLGLVPDIKMGREPSARSIAKMALKDVNHYHLMEMRGTRAWTTTRR